MENQQYFNDEIYKFLNHMSTCVGDKITEYHWREICGLIKYMEDNNLIENIWTINTKD